MRLQHVVSRVEAWRGDVAARCAPLLSRARAEMVRVQSAPDADERIAHHEEALISAVDDVLNAAESELESMRDDVSLFFENVDQASPEEQEVADRIDRVDAELREWLTRKVASLVAQARAQELAAVEPPPAVKGPEVPDAGEASTLPDEARAVRPLRQPRRTELGHVSPDAIAQRFEAHVTDPTLPGPGAAPPVKRFCTECGGPLVSDPAGVRRCARCGHTP